MKCYYEELALERNANENEIKSAYRKLALKWHPDKNPECLEVAKERFQLIQQAYEVLSDPQERAWYDNHREQILRGKNSNFEDNCLDLFQYFTVTCFKGFEDDDNGFYAVYREVFNKISAEDAEFMDNEEELLQIPKFGDSKSNYEMIVGPFYAYWSAYCTKRTYTWLCPYDIREVKDRRILREIEKETKKIAQKARKERNEEVRNLVSYVRKRDKRVQTFKKMLEERSAFNREKQERNRMEQKRRRQQEIEQMKGSHQAIDDYEEKLKELEQEYSSDEDFFEEDELEENEDTEAYDWNDVLYCVACNKEFKTKKSFANHETSKKHRDNIEKLKLKMHDEENFYLQGEKNLIKIKETETTNFEDENSKAILSNEEDLTSITHKSTKTKSKKEAKNSKQFNKLELADINEVTEEIDKLNITKEDNEDWDTKHKKFNKKNKSKKIKNNPNSLEQTIQSNTEISKNKEENVLKSEAAPYECATCKSNFESKNKLFSHLKLTNHAILVPNIKNANGNTKSGKSRKRN